MGDADTEGQGIGTLSSRQRPHRLARCEEAEWGRGASRPQGKTHSGDQLLARWRFSPYLELNKFSYEELSPNIATEGSEVRQEGHLGWHVRHSEGQQLLGNSHTSRRLRG